MDATRPYRNFLSSHSIHDYESQAWGADNSKKSLPLKLIDQYGVRDLPDAHLYRAKTRGDRRINLPNEGDYLSGGEILVSIWIENQLYLLNASRLSFADSRELVLLIQGSQASEPIRTLLTAIGRPEISETDLLHLTETALERVAPGGLRIAVGMDPSAALGKLRVGILDPDQGQDWNTGLVILMSASDDATQIKLEICHGLVLRLEHGNPPAALGPASLHPLNSNQDPSAQDQVNVGGKTEVRSSIGAKRTLCETFNMLDLPSESALSTALQHWFAVYQDVIISNPSNGSNGITAELENGPTRARVSGRAIRQGSVFRQFKPKTRDDYSVHYKEQNRKNVADRHEYLLRQYADLALELGYQPTNIGVHPRDLTLIVDGEEWLVEAKVLYRGNATHAVRAAIAQLLEYSYFLYPDSRRPRLMALFSEPVGAAFVDLCSSLDIAAVWKGSEGWEGCQVAERSGLVKGLT
jgi:hypothetical protein